MTTHEMFRLMKEHLLTTFAILLQLGTVSAQTTVIDKPGVYIGSWQGDNATPAITVNCTGVYIYKSTISGSGILIQVNPGAGVTVQDSYLDGLNPNVYGYRASVGVSATQASKLYVLNCAFRNLGSAIIEDSAFCGWPDILIQQCSFEHQNARLSNGGGGWLWSQGWNPNITFMRTKSYNNEQHRFSIHWCDIINTAGVDWTEDQINLYQSAGCDISYNYIQDSIGPTWNGIVTDDPWADGIPRTPEYNWTAYDNTIHDNILVTASIGIWAGHDNRVYNNFVVNSGKLANGQWNTAHPQFGLGRFNPEGDAWAQTNSVTGNVSGVIYPTGGRQDYIDEVHGSGWMGNTLLKKNVINTTEAQVYSTKRQPELSQRGLTIGPS